MSNLPRIEKLQRIHNLEPFDCGQDDLNRFLIRHALQNQQSGGSMTYVALVEQEIVGFYALSYGQVEYADAPERLTKGLGSGMLKDAMLRTLQAAEIAGLRALTAHAKDDNARTFYERFDFIPFPTDPYHMAILLKDIRAILQT